MQIIKAIIFDFDGVIGDTYAISFDILKIFFKKLTEQQFKDYFNGNVYEKPIIKLGKEDVRLFFEKQKEQFTENHLFPLRDVLDRLNNEYRLFIVSSNTNENIEHFLRLGNLNSFFQKILGATAHESKIEKFNMIFNDFRVKPEECLFVTDTMGDIIEAREVNIKTIAVTWGYHEKETLHKMNPFAIAHDENELLRIIEEIRGKGF